MSVRVAKNLFINFSSVAKYRHFLGGVSDIVELGKHLTLAAETAQLMRQTDAVREYGLILSNLPVKEYQLIGQYYLGWYACCSGGQVTASLFENIFEESKTYKAKSLITLGALAGAKGDLEGEIRHHKEALKYSDVATSIRIVRAIAIVKSKEGFHKSAIRSLESVLPVLQFAQPQVYYNTLNSLAVELGEVGRVEEASSICKVVLASPYAFAYPEWRETGADIVRRGYKSRSVISVDQPFSELENVIQLPIPEYKSRPVQTKPGRLLNYVEWIKKMVKEPNGNKKDDKTSEELDNMTNKDLLVEILQRTSKKDMSDRKLRKILEFVMEVELEPED
jgi:hypothetical protein